MSNDNLATYTGLLLSIALFCYSSDVPWWVIQCGGFENVSLPFSSLSRRLQPPWGFLIDRLIFRTTWLLDGN
jgi:hypothetical protein